MLNFPRKVMTDIERLFSELLSFGLDWKVEKIQVNHSSKEVDIFLNFNKEVGIFPGSTDELPIYDLSSLRRVRHLDVFDYTTYINFRTPRVKNESGDVRQINIGWVDSRVSYTYKFENKVIEALLMSKNQSKTAEFFDTTFDIVHIIMLRAVERGLLRRNLSDMPALSIDEKSFGNGQKYLSVLSDPFQKRVLDVIEGRKQENAEELIYCTLDPKVLEKVQLISMDMWDPFMNAAKELIPNAKIIHDKFHIAKIINKGVDEVRKREVKTRVELKNTKYIFPKKHEDLTQNQVARFEIINQLNLVTSQAWRLKENFNGIYHLGSKYSCLEYFAEWYVNTLKSQIKEMIKVADTILRHLKGVINAATHQLSNSMAECINSQIQTVKTVARGFKNFAGYRNAVLFFQGKLNLFPL